MYCHQCGSQLPDHVKFCPKCGVWVSDAPPNQTALDQKQRIPVLGIAVISIFIVAAAAIAVIMAAYTRASRQGSSPTAAGHLTDKESDHMTKAGESDQNDTVADIALGAYAEKVQELAADDSTLLFALIDIDGNDIPELVADSPGCYVSLYTWADGGLITLMDAWVYGAMGNQGYDYIPGHNIVHNYNFDQSGAVVLETYLAINKYYELTALSGDLRLCYFNDTNRNGITDENEPFTEEPFYYFGDAEITEEEYDSYHIEGDYEWISGDKTAAEILELLEAGR